MPLVYEQNINESTKLGVWHITEPEPFFMQQVPLQRDITHPHKRLQHLAGRYLLKELYPDFPYELIRIADTRKPFLENEAYHFSISHSGDYAAVIVSKTHRVGVDVEQVSARAEKLRQKFLTEKEQALIKEAADKESAASPDELLTATWSVKESLFKWLAGKEVDFKKHLVISGVSCQGKRWSCNASILKELPVYLTVYFQFFDGNCLSWVCGTS